MTDVCAVWVMNMNRYGISDGDISLIGSVYVFLKTLFRIRNFPVLLVYLVLSSRPLQTWIAGVHTYRGRATWHQAAPPI